MDDIYSLLMESEEPTAQEKAQAMAAALRRQQAVGNLGLLTGDRVLSRFGQAQLQQAGSGLEGLDAAAKSRFGMTLQRSLAKDRQAFEAGESEKDRTARAAEGARSRALQRTLFGEKKAAKEEAAAGKEERQGLMDATSLRKEFNARPAVKDFGDIQVAFDKIQSAAAQPSAAGDLSLIFSYMKILDPGSSVKEGEFANAQNAGGVDDRLISTYNQVRAGQRLSPEQRADFIAQSKKLFHAHETQMIRETERYRTLASRRGLDPDDVAQAGGGGTAVPAAAKTTPANGSLDLDEDDAAVKWAKANPNDPRAAEILSLHGGQ